MENILYKPLDTPVMYFERNLSDYLRFCDALKHRLTYETDTAEPIFLCIGTDRMTGDCLGPLVGHKLQKYNNEKFHVFGTLEKPVHALNLNYAMTKIKLCFSNPFIIAIDASLGLPGHIGNITLTHGSIQPGEGMNKNLGPVGDLSITGIVGSCHGNSTLLLQNTRLHLVNELADYISAGLMNCFSF